MVIYIIKIKCYTCTGILIFQTSKEKKLGLKIKLFVQCNEKAAIKLQCSTEGREMIFGLSYQKVRKIEGLSPGGGGGTPI